jgi:hypothetical protein
LNCHTPQYKCHFLPKSNKRNLSPTIGKRLFLMTFTSKYHLY